MAGPPRHSNRGLAKGAGLSQGTIGNARKGTDTMGVEALARVAVAAGESPRYFAEVRLEAVRRLLDPADLPSALAHLAVFERALEEAGLSPANFPEPDPTEQAQAETLAEAEQLEQETAGVGRKTRGRASTAPAPLRPKPGSQ